MITKVTIFGVVLLIGGIVLTPIAFMMYFSMMGHLPASSDFVLNLINNIKSASTISGCGIGIFFMLVGATLVYYENAKMVGVNIK
ncbi:MAG: hypothetical protein WCX79_00420 [Candidatus Paceibacterota bacterium]|jgi:hypothetical protein